VELAEYAEHAVRLVNSERPGVRDGDALDSVAAVRELFGPAAQAAARVTEADVTRLRAVRTRLRGVFEAAAEGDEVRAVDLLNALLLEFPVSPQVSGHRTTGPDGRPAWHLHLAENAATAAAGWAATACMGLATQLTALGVDRLGVCQAPPCRNAYLDTTTNRSRRYCSDRCATRANVAAYRARRRSGRTDEPSQAASAAGER
jgi:predicted RNA-binding Zn ribbon-like protein